MATVFGRQNGMPGAIPSEELNPDMEKFMLTTQTVIGTEEIQKAGEILKKYKDGKANLENRIVDDELWWELRHWESLRKQKDPKELAPEPTSAWLFNSILNKHADAMDNYPEPVVLPRERSDIDSAKVLSSVLPVLLEYNDFEQTYSDNWWEKLKHGTACYGVFWNTEKENGLGDIDIKSVDLLKVFWEPGITDIQKSRNLFIVDLVDTDLLDEMYPDKKGKLKGDVVDVKQYLFKDNIDNSDKSVVVDWYYKVKQPGGNTVVHYCKFVGDELLYASENDSNYQQKGFYDHGQYPLVFDVMFPEKNTPVGFGYVAICKDPQMYIDKLSGNILETSMMHTKKRYFASDSTNINLEQFMDWNRPIIDVQGEIDDSRIKELSVTPLDSIYVNILQMKIEEMKDTASNRDVNSGGVGSGVTAAAAIAALQEAGNKASRDMIAASYRANNEIIQLCIELIRQFYDEARAFRVVAPNEIDGYGFVDLDNAQLRDQMIGTDSNGLPLYRRPVFDLKIKSQKKNPFSRMEMNETAKELYGAGFFNPDQAQPAMIALNMMEFEGIDQIKEQVMQGQTLMNIAQQLSQENALLKAALGIQPQTVEGGQAQTQASAPVQKDDMKKGDMMSMASNMTDYGQRIAKRSRPSMDNSSNAATPK